HDAPQGRPTLRFRKWRAAAAEQRTHLPTALGGSGAALGSSPLAIAAGALTSRPCSRRMSRSKTSWSIQPTFNPRPPTTMSRRGRVAATDPALESNRDHRNNATPAIRRKQDPPSRPMIFFSIAYPPARRPNDVAQQRSPPMVRVMMQEV